MKHKLNKLSKNQFGFGHHIILPLVLIVVVGIIGVYLTTRINAATCISSTFSYGSSGTCVKYIQQLANGISATGATISVDGAFQGGTRTKVKAVQTKYSLTADGIVGSNTWKKLCAYSTNKTAAGNAGCNGIADYSYSCTISSVPSTIYKGSTYTAKVTYKNTGKKTLTGPNSNPVMSIYDGSSLKWQETPSSATSSYNIAPGQSYTVAFGPRGTASYTAGKSYSHKFVLYRATNGSSTSLMPGSSCSKTITVR